MSHSRHRRWPAAVVGCSAEGHRSGRLCRASGRAGDPPPRSRIVTTDGGAGSRRESVPRPGTTVRVLGFGSGWWGRSEWGAGHVFRAAVVLPVSAGSGSGFATSVGGVRRSPGPGRRPERVARHRPRVAGFAARPALPGEPGPHPQERRRLTALPWPQAGCHTSTEIGHEASSNPPSRSCPPPTTSASPSPTQVFQITRYRTMASCTTPHGPRHHPTANCPMTSTNDVAVTRPGRVGLVHLAFTPRRSPVRPAWRSLTSLPAPAGPPPEASPRPLPPRPTPTTPAGWTSG